MFSTRFIWELSVKDLEGSCLKNADSLSQSQTSGRCRMEGLVKMGGKDIRETSSVHNENETENHLLEKCIRCLKYVESVIWEAQILITALN